MKVPPAPLLTCLALVALAATAPSWLDPYYLGILITTLVYVALTSAWNIVGGMAGQFSLGHSLFVALGGVLVGSLVALHGWNIWLAMAAAAGLSALLALGMALLLFRSAMPPLSFALITLALAEVGLLVVLSQESLGAASGVVLEPEDGFGIVELDGYLYLTLALCAAVVLIAWVILHSSLGFRLRAMRDDEAAAAAIGVDVFRTKTIALVVSAVLSSVVATVYANYTSFIDPHLFVSPVVSINIILYAVVGGLGTVRGPVIGTALLLPLGEILRGEFGDLAGLNLVVFGLAIVVVVLYAPGGLSELLDRLKTWATRPPASGPPASEPARHSAGENAQTP